jgi:hypothetical protein
VFLFLQMQLLVILLHSINFPLESLFFVVVVGHGREGSFGK